MGVTGNIKVDRIIRVNLVKLLNDINGITLSAAIFIGIETTSLPILTLYDNYKDYDVLDEAETIAKYDRAAVVRKVQQLIQAAVQLRHRITVICEPIRPV